MIGMVYVIFPGIYFAVALFPLVFIARYENIGFGKAFGRSTKLIKDNWWKTFGLIILLSITVMIIGALFQLPMQIQTFSGIFANLNDPSQISNISVNIFFVILSQVGNVLVVPILIIGTALHYFNLVERKEKKSILADIDQIGAE
jgi:hypothetical protein